jgi:hypothetical protein
MKKYFVEEGLDLDHARKFREVLIGILKINI